MADLPGWAGWARVGAPLAGEEPMRETDHLSGLCPVSHQPSGTIVLVDTGRFPRASLPAGRELTFWLLVRRCRPSKRTRALFGAI